MKSRLILMLCMSLFVVACAASTSKTYDADGKVAYVITCQGDLRNWGSCYEKAGELCGTKGYDIINKSIPRSMTIRCK